MLDGLWLGWAAVGVTWLLLQLPVPNVDDDSEDEFEEETDEDEKDDSRLPIMGSESRRGGTSGPPWELPVEEVGSLLTLRTTGLVGLAAAGLEEPPAVPRLKISHLLLLTLTLTPLLVLGLLLDLQLVLLVVVVLLLCVLKLKIALVDMRRSLLLSLAAALLTADSTAEADFLMGDDNGDDVHDDEVWVRFRPLPVAPLGASAVAVAGAVAAGS